MSSVMDQGSNRPDSDHDVERLVLLARGGDPAACEALLSAHLPALRGFVRLRLGRALRSKEESLDIVQSICGDALKELGGFEHRGAGSFRRWLLQCAENKLRARGRFWARERRSLVREVPLDDADVDGLRALAHTFTPLDAATSREELMRLERAFAELSEPDRTVILLARVAGLDHAAVAAEMGRTDVATRSLLSRALARLAAKLEPRR
jgi:RNA polymerase sigma-70 factor (ECF subfamily)